MSEINNLGEFFCQPIEKEFGKLKTNKLIITDERISHIQLRHHEDYELFIKYGIEVVNNPDEIIVDGKNENTVFMIKKLQNTNLNAVVKVTLETDDSDYINSVMTFYRIRNKNLKKLEKKWKTIYIKE